MRLENLGTVYFLRGGGASGIDGGRGIPKKMAFEGGIQKRGVSREIF